MMPKEQQLKGVIIGILCSALVITSFACNSFPFNSPTLTRTPTNTPLSTPTQNATATQTPEPILYPSSWNLLFEDKFDENVNNWPVISSGDEWGSVEPTINDGKYKVFLESGNIGFRFPFYQTKLVNIKNYYMSVDIEELDNDNNAYYGMELRTTDGESYVLVIDDDASAYFLGYSDTSSWTVIIDWTTTSSIKKQGVNNLGIVIFDSSIKIIINGVEIENISNSMIMARGGFGLTVGLYKGNDQVTVLFDNLVVYGP